jgi:uncharacterized lipoprotein NlpE involved in copper resistance
MHTKSIIAATVLALSLVGCDKTATVTTTDSTTAPTVTTSAPVATTMPETTTTMVHAVIIPPATSVPETTTTAPPVAKYTDAEINDMAFRAYVKTLGVPYDTAKELADHYCQLRADGMTQDDIVAVIAVYAVQNGFTNNQVTVIGKVIGAGSAAYCPD